MDLYEKHPELRDKYVIIALHTPDVKDWDEYDAKIKPVIEKVWKGRTPAFPIALDATGETFDRYAAHELPVDLLIDPSGNVVPHGSIVNLSKALGVK
jgi:hypothetical protein